jgi:catechol O-methyltransferase
MTIGTDKGRHIVKLIEERRPSTMIELGTFVGYSAVLFGDAVRAAGGKQYICLEINPVNAAVATMMVELAGLRDFVKILVAPSHVSLARLVQQSVIDHVEVMFIDHWKDRYLPDLWLTESLGLLKPGLSVLVADNVLFPGAPEYLDWVRASPEDKREKLKKHSFPQDLPHGADLIKAVKEGAQDLDLQNVPGNPELVYETEITIFHGRSGRKVGIPDMYP